MKFALIAFGNEESYGLLFVGGELLAHGQTIRFFDAEEPGVEEHVCSWKPDFVCFSPMTVFFDWAHRTALEIKRRQPGCVTVFGGHHAVAKPDIAAIEGVDAVVVGPVRGSVERLLKGERGVLRTAPTSPDDLPQPARREYYGDIPRMAGRYRKIMLSMLGCPWNCAYCSSASGHTRDRFGADALQRYFLSRRPLAAILEEARVLLQYPTKEIEWVDDDLFHGRDADAWLSAFVDAWMKDIKLPMYVSTTSVNALRVSAAALEKLRACVNCVGLGLQAARPESLALFNRSWDSEERIKAAYDRLVAHGYRVNLQCIVGLPVEDPVEDALETIKALQRIGPGSICSCYPLIVYPGTRMEQVVRERGFTLNDACPGDTNSGIPHIRFDDITTRRIRNLCKLATLFVKHNVDERWMRALLDMELDEKASRALSTARYHDCVVDRLGATGERIFEDILQNMKLRY